MYKYEKRREKKEEIETFYFQKIYNTDWRIHWKLLSKIPSMNLPVLNFDNILILYVLILCTVIPELKNVEHVIREIGKYYLN